VKKQQKATKEKVSEEQTEAIEEKSNEKATKSN
jgi:hypothetical protein